MTSRARTIVLAFSLAANLFLVGVLAGGVYIWTTQSGGGFGQRVLRAAADGLPDDKQTAFRQMLADARRDTADQAAASREARATLNTLMRAPILDRPAIDAALAAIRTSDGAIRMRLEKTMVDFTQSLSPAERLEFVDKLESRSAILRRPQR